MTIIASRPYIAYGRLKYQPFGVFRNGNKIERIWEDINIFLESCTTTNRDSPKYIELSTYEKTYKASEDKEVARKIVADAKAIFGEAQYDPEEEYPTQIYWEIAPNDLHKAVEYMIKGQPWPTYYFGPIQLLLTYFFKLVDPKTKKELENQQFESFLLIFLSGNSFCSSCISFPFSEPDKNFKEYLSQLDKYLPFTLDPNYLRLVKSNKKGTSNYFRKLSPGL